MEAKYGALVATKSTMVWLENVITQKICPILALELIEDYS
jgi:hypothetical protein